MGWLIAALGTGLAIGGTMAIYFGAPYIQVEWGYAEVIAGTTALSAGILAVGLAAVLFAIRDLGNLVMIGAGGVATRPSAQADATGSGPAIVVPVPIEPASIPTEPLPGDDEPAKFRPGHHEAPVTDQAATVVGRYEANGASYVLFSDGTIEVETETGTHRYASMGDLRAHIEQQETN